MPAVRFARNESFASDDEPLAAGDRVALIPPVSGGEEDKRLWVDVLDGTLPIERVTAFVEGDAGSGGIVIFKGLTRHEVDDEHGALIRLDYEAYDAMATQELRRLAEQAMDRWSLSKIAVVHRVGGVPVGEASVAIAVAGAHRAECFDACRWTIDTLKRDVPIWKKDVFADGFVRWVDPAGGRGQRACLVLRSASSMGVLWVTHLFRGAAFEWVIGIVSPTAEAMGHPPRHCRVEHCRK